MISEDRQERIRKVVQRGAEMLDKKEEGWEILIDTDKLDINSSMWCVLGQIGRARGYYSAPFDRVMYDLGISRTLPDMGFVNRLRGDRTLRPNDHVDAKEWREQGEFLNEEWVRQIKSRLNK